jgi:hypothetical protein
MSAETPIQPDIKNDTGETSDSEFYCPRCAAPVVGQPLACGDCGSLICRNCGTPVERIDELGIG